MHKTCKRPYQLAGRPNDRPTEGNPLSGCPGRPARELLLSGSGPGRPGGRPEGTTVKNLTVGRSTDRSTGPRVGRPDRSTDVHKDVHTDQPLGPVDRLQVPHSQVGAVDRTVDRKAWHGRPSGRLAKEQLLSGLARSTGRSTGRLNYHIFDRWPVDRPVDRKVISDLVSCQRANFYGAYLYPI